MPDHRTELLQGTLDLLILRTLEDAEARGRRGLRLAGLADHLSRGDELLAMNEVASAREAYLGALEQAPREVSCLLALGHLDASFEGRWESALSYFEEARNVLGDERRLEWVDAMARIRSGSSPLTQRCCWAAVAFCASGSHLLCWSMKLA